MRKTARGLILLFGLCLIAIGFQNCSGVRNGSNNESLNSQLSGNGEPYEGKIFSTYFHFDPANACADLDLHGKPLPNGEIVFVKNKVGGASPLVRENCQDKAALPLTSSALTFAANNSIIYSGRPFHPTAEPGDFDIVAASCPAPLNPIAGATRTNLYTNSANWLTPEWGYDPGVSGQIAGAINSIPSFLLTRDNSQYLDSWRRVGQEMGVKANTRYAFSFLAKAGSLSAIDWRVTSHNTPTTDPLYESANITFDLVTMSTTVQWVKNIAGLSATIQPVANGFLCTIYFTSSSTDNQPGALDFEVTPSAGAADFGKLGDSVEATASQLVEVGQFCR